MNKLSKHGFTLAEVLITLGIIGVVAALTIPSLISNYQKSQYVVGLKKAYSQSNNALMALTVAEGSPSDIKATGLFTDDFDITRFGDAYASQFNILKNYGIDGTDLPDDAIVNTQFDGGAPSGSFKDYWNGSGSYMFTTADGTFFAINSAGDCTTDYSGGQNNAFTQICGEMEVDVNGFKKPNYYGRDIFRFLITNGRGAAIIPYGAQGDDSIGYWKDLGYCADSDHSNDMYCAAKIIDEGWEMNY